MNNTLFPITANLFERHQSYNEPLRAIRQQLRPHLAAIVEAQDHLNELYNLQEKIQEAESNTEARIPRPLSLYDVGLGTQHSHRFAQCETLEGCLVVLEWDIERATYLLDRACAIMEHSLNPNLIQEVKDNFKGLDLELKYNLPTLDPSRM